jgi:hypothetical protein
VPRNSACRHQTAADSDTVRAKIHVQLLEIAQKTAFGAQIVLPISVKLNILALSVSSPFV